MKKIRAAHSTPPAGGAGVVTEKFPSGSTLYPDVAPRRIFPRSLIVNEFLGLKKA
jgi:hypothetical protein